MPLTTTQLEFQICPCVGQLQSCPEKRANNVTFQLLQADNTRLKENPTREHDKGTLSMPVSDPTVCHPRVCDCYYYASKRIGLISLLHRPAASPSRAGAVQCDYRMKNGIKLTNIGLPNICATRATVEVLCVNNKLIADGEQKKKTEKKRKTAFEPTVNEEQGFISVQQLTSIFRSEQGLALPGTHGEARHM